MLRGHRLEKSRRKSKCALSKSLPMKNTIYMGPRECLTSYGVRTSIVAANGWHYSVATLWMPKASDLGAFLR